MYKKDELFELIKLLSNNEKRYFTLFASRHTIGEKNNYLRLFHALEKQKGYNEEQLLKLYNGTSVQKKFSLSKTYLYNLILKSMRVYRMEDSVNMQLNGLLCDVEFLFQKGLFKSCEKIIGQAKQLAEKHEKYVFMQELLNWEKQLIKRQEYSGSTRNELEKISRQIGQCIDKCKSIYEYDIRLIRLMIELRKQGFIRNHDKKRKYKNSMEGSLINKKWHRLPFRAKIILYTYNTAYFNEIKSDKKKSYQYAKKQLQLIEQYPHLLTDRKEGYASALKNLLSYQLSLKKYKEMSLTIQKLKSIYTTSKPLNNYILYSASIMEITMCIDMGEFDRAVQLIPNMENITVNGLTKIEKMIMYYEFCNAYFGVGEYSKANIYLNKIINDPVDVRNDLQCFSRILSIIIHFELGHAELLEYAVQSTYRFLLRRKRLYKFETLILNFIKKEFPKINPDTSEQLLAFKKLKADIESVTKDPFERKALNYFDFISWLESKIENRPFAEVVKEKSIVIR